MRTKTGNIALGTVEILRCGVAMSVPGLADIKKIPDVGWIDERELIKLGKESKLLTQAVMGLRQIDYGISDVLQKEEAAYRKFILALNSINLRSVVQVSAALAQADIRFLLFKGPLAQKLAYGGYFQRPSSDVDILVSRGDIGRCTRVLEDVGYFLPAECDRIWWRSFLGEQHFFARLPHRATVDLHHRLQQPGCPQPRHVAAFMDEPAMHRLNGTDIPCLAPVDATLLAGLSFVKSLVQHCHSAAYLADFCALLLRLNGGERTELRRRAVRQNVENSLRLTLSCATAMFGLRCPELGRPLPVDDLFGDDLALAVFAPDDPAIGWPRLRRLLWRLCDDRAPGQRLGTYAWVGTSFLASKIARSMPAPQVARDARAAIEANPLPG